jgi:hypothetical protein
MPEMQEQFPAGALMAQHGETKEHFSAGACMARHGPNEASFGHGRPVCRKCRSNFWPAGRPYAKKCTGSSGSLLGKSAQQRPYAVEFRSVLTEPGNLG